MEGGSPWGGGALDPWLGVGVSLTVSNPDLHFRALFRTNDKIHSLVLRKFKVF